MCAPLMLSPAANAHQIVTSGPEGTMALYKASAKPNKPTNKKKMATATTKAQVRIMP